MLFRKRTLPEICRYCSKFLKQEQRIIDICTDCAKKSRDSVQKSFKIRTLIGLLLASIFLAVLSSFNVNNFDNVITSLSANLQIAIMVACFYLSFGEFVSLENF